MNKKDSLEIVLFITIPLVLQCGGSYKTSMSSANKLPLINMLGVKKKSQWPPAAAPVFTVRQTNSVLYSLSQTQSDKTVEEESK